MSAQPEALVRKIARDSKRYPANPNWHDHVLYRHMPAEEETNRVTEAISENIAAAMRKKVRCVIFNLDASVARDARYHPSSRTNQSIASSRILNLWNSRREKVFSAS